MRALLLAACAAVRALPSPPTGTASAALSALTAVLGRDAAPFFSIALQPGAPCAELTGGGSGPVSITAASAVDAIHAAGQFLQTTLNASFSWELTGGIQLVNFKPGGALPAVPGGAMRLCRAVPWTYYQNVVQSSYSNVWWDAARWERELVWAALKGVNIALAYGGQEALWRQTFLSLGLTGSVLDGFFGGPAYLSWSRGQGLQGVGGPLPSWWYPSQLQLNQQVVARMAELGICAVLPVFQGNVPPQLHALFPGANISTDGWLDVFDPLFARVQDTYMGLLLQAYPQRGCSAYEADGLFSHASGPWRSGSGSAGLGGDAQARSRAAYSSFARHDSAAVWVYQTWIWRDFATQADLAYISEWLSGPPAGSWFLLDQTAEREPIWSKFSNFSFNGEAFAWLSMNNMGGNEGLVGSLEGVRQGVAAALEGSRGALIGVGIDPEGINTNPAYFEYVLLQGWAQPPAPQAFLGDFGVRRCGADVPGVRQAWGLLGDTVYAANQSNFEHHMHYCGPALPAGLGTGWDSPPFQPAFPPAPLGQAWGLLLQAAPACPAAAPASGFAWDVADVGREYLSLFPCLDALQGVMAARDAAGVSAAGAALASALADTDALLGTQAGFLVGAWIADARRLGAAAAPNSTAADLDLLEWNARSQVTTWYPTPPGPSNHLYDYANKQWQGVTGTYYAARYARLVGLAREAAAAGRPGAVNRTAFAAALQEVGEEWTLGRAPASVFPELPTGNTFVVAQQLYQKYKVQGGD